MATGIHPVRLPEDIERGAQGGPRFKTTIMQIDSGQERRNIDWALPLAEWDIGYGIQGPDDFRRVRAFFYARRGRGYGFLFKDWTDFNLIDPGDPPIVLTFGSQGEARGLNKIYRDDTGIPFWRRITHPVWNTLTFTDTNTGNVIPRSSFDINSDYRIFLVRGSAVTVSVTGEFDIPVRFSSDRLEQTVAIYDGVETPDIGITELRPRTIENRSQQPEVEQALVRIQS